MAEDFRFEPGSPSAAQVERLAWRLHTSKRAAGPEVVLLCSCWPDEGKSTVALQLSHTLAASGHKVLLVDGDTRRPALSHALGFRGQGFVEFLQEPEFRHVNRVTDHLDALGSGTSRELILSPEGAEVARFRKKVADYSLVVLDSPPLSVCSDALVLAELSDRAVLVVSRRSYRGQAEPRLVKELRSTALPVEGLVLTHAEEDSASTGGEPWWHWPLIWLGLKP